MIKAGRETCQKKEPFKELSTVSARFAHTNGLGGRDASNSRVLGEKRNFDASVASKTKKNSRPRWQKTMKLGHRKPHVQTTSSALGDRICSDWKYEKTWEEFPPPSKKGVGFYLGWKPTVNGKSFFHNWNLPLCEPVRRGFVLIRQSIKWVSFALGGVDLFSFYTRVKFSGKTSKHLRLIFFSLTIVVSFSKPCATWSTHCALVFNWKVK